MIDAGEALRVLSRAGVEFMVVGGIAGVLHGAARATQDLEAIAELEALDEESRGQA